jgi:hypothetical protein
LEKVVQRQGCEQHAPSRRATLNPPMSLFGVRENRTLPVDAPDLF